jgi:hypothetical protein
MDIDFKILIDASGSMGYMKGSKKEGKYLLPDGKTRTDLVKKIINTSLKDVFPLTTNLDVLTFRKSISLDKYGNKIIKIKDAIDAKGRKIKQQYHPAFNDLKPIYNGAINTSLIKDKINAINNPDIGGTPLWWSLSVLVNKSKTKTIIIVLSDGDANDKANFDAEILKLIETKKKDCVIYFIGIDQDEVATKKSKNLATKTGGIYINLKAINYDTSKLDVLLSQLKTQLAANVLKESIILTKSNPVTIPSETENNSSTSDIENQVKRNTQSLGHISIQLDNILKLLHSQSDESIDNIEIIENTIYNQRIGRDSEKYLFNELKELFKNNNLIKVIWLNEIEEKGHPYDILVQDGRNEFYYECKGTGYNLNEFQLTKNEWNFYLNNIGKYRLCFASNIDSTPSYIRLMDLLSDMKNKTIVPCATQNRKYKADRIVFQINKE